MWPTLEDMNVCALSLCSDCEVPVFPVPVIFFLLESIQARSSLPGGVHTRIRLHSSGSLFLLERAASLRLGVAGSASLQLGGVMGLGKV